MLVIAVNRKFSGPITTNYDVMLNVNNRLNENLLMTWPGVHMRHTSWKDERALFYYNGHGVPKPAANGEIWLFNKLQDCTFTSSSAGTPARDCILLAACEAHETLPHSVEFPVDIFTSCLTTPFKMVLRW
ncbi:hypothetical protein POM88_041252 [Heracleum sosnowskyi]|uniref:Raptor N-terminal CASPase-like domain-containing protein n=1 Tax=Heracleum sosnowskyi TaxID=360622 RepID=A0AAD8HEM9_9APIA|nr:hypothetical protein POM88_041252 [Heracleum sosnowskyi]